MTEWVQQQEVLAMKIAIAIAGVALVLCLVVFAARLLINLVVEQDVCDEYDDWHKN